MTSDFLSGQNEEQHHNRATGKQGEDLAVEYLQARGYHILERNYHNAFGEIDIIAFDQRILCFIEVKTRYSDEYGNPLEAVNKKKQRQIGKMALIYLRDAEFEWSGARFDVIGITLNESPEKQLHLIKNAFEFVN
ncbi:MAG: YraN family protein [Candidatus Omnitrophica bacterium]|nr:YraN family protein [Candidatus Omnitrophota bacterium]